MEQPREPRFYPNKESINISVCSMEERTLQSIEETLKRIETILLRLEQK